MRGVNKNKLSSTRMNPSVFLTAAREGQLVDLVVFDHAELQIAIERGGCNRLPVAHALALSKER